MVASPVCRYAMQSTTKNTREEEKTLLVICCCWSNQSKSSRLPASASKTVKKEKKMDHSNQSYNSSHKNSTSSGLQNGSRTVNGSINSSSGGESSSSALDHALLESLFYNEMVMLNGNSPSSSNFLTQHFHEASQAPKESALPVATDVNTIAEKEMLRDFGVTSSPMILHSPPGARSEAWLPQSAANHDVMQSSTSHTSIPLNPAPQHAPPGAIASFMSSSSSQPIVQNPATATTSSTPALSIEPPVSHERAKQLVDQFATLASRLGIDLPDNVLQSLTTAAAKNDPSLEGQMHNTTKNNGKNGDADFLENDSYSPHLGQDEFEQAGGAPRVEELRKTAEQAIAAVSRKRPPEEPKETNQANNKPLYSKRRKKPRLSDCESRLAQLKAENKVLKLHLQNVSNKAHQIEQGKEESARRIKQLHDHHAGPEEMDKVVKDMTDMYSDYGCNRQQELSFHLEQLSRLVVPTNFTKLGLWTLGQNSSNPKRNPIAGILQKELDITPQQGRKIVEQSEKIKSLCDNLKECLALLAKLKSLCEQKTQIFHDRMAKCREILTTKQTVKLIIWINEHYELLDTVCPGWGTEHIH